ncbi:hypothetical protein ACFYXF_03860 [Streptomyces sp. NPDC002680]|uniref:hypothetical protein n=1 Tax=Streptomyces sp. NPDC002680 TaxID=3364659 RepID=UPI0036C6CB0E
MTTNHRIRRALTAGSLGLAVTVGGMAGAGTAQAADTGRTTISCSAVKVRKAPARTATVVGVAYRRDTVVYDQWAYKRSERTWYTRGTVTRRSDGKKVRGYMIYQCANPYGSTGAPTPPIPK